MLSRIMTSAVKGINAVAVSVEVDISRGFPGINVVGLADATVKEAAARIKSAIKNSGYEFPVSNITINLSPAWIRKKGSQFDLPMAIGILLSSGQLFDRDIEDMCFIGELSLDGRINKCNGILPMISEVKKSGIKKVVIPRENSKEAALFDEIDVYCASNLSEVCDAINLKKELEKVSSIGKNKLCDTKQKNFIFSKDFRDVKGQDFVKRAIVVAVSGGHGILMTGSPGIGKTMIAERIPEIMPSLSFDEIIDITSVYSVAGMLDEHKGYISHRPFRAVGPSITRAGLIGGGTSLKLGEISLAHKGVLFMDEFYEIEKNVLESLRMPLENKVVRFIRNGDSFTFPSDFLLVAAANPCKCGYYGDTEHECSCSSYEIAKYRSRVSGPILDRIDINIEMTQVRFDDLGDCESMSSAEMKDIIENARSRQKNRYKNERFDLNSQIEDSLLDKYVCLDSSQKIFLKNAYTRFGLSPRSVNKIKKLARTIADIEDEENISTLHLAEALRYRERKVK